MEAAAAKAMAEAMADLHSRAVNQAPIDTGDLRSSARHGVDRSNGEIVGWVNFDSPYAAVQHEGHFNHPKGGNRKYLENPFRENAARYGQHIARAIRREIG